MVATLSLGPVGISDGLGLTDTALISQAFRNANDSTLLRPSRPLSTIDAVFANASARAASNGINGVNGFVDALTPTVPGASDVRSTHAALGVGSPVSHYVLAWMTTEEVTLQATDLYPSPPKVH